MKRHFLLLWQALRALAEHQGQDYANAIAYLSLVSLFPFLIFLTAIAGFLGNAHHATDIINYGFRYLPANVVETLKPVIAEVLNTTTPSLLTFGIIGTLWTASSGMETLRTALNNAYNAKETRPFWKRRLQTMLLILIAGLGMIILFLTVIAGPLVSSLSEYFLHASRLWILAWDIFRYITGFAVVVLLAGMVYFLLPNNHRHFKEGLPGALISGVLWVGCTTVFTWLFALVIDYSKTYGSLGGVITTLLYFQFSAIILIAGAEYNACKQRLDSV